MAKDQVSDAMPLFYYWLAYRMRETPAVSYGVVDYHGQTGDGRVYSGGVRGVGSEYDPNEDTQYSIGSITKIFTALAVHQLAADGKLSLDAPIERFLSPPKDRPEVYSQITVRHLLTHTSGLAREGGFLLDECLVVPEDVTYSQAHAATAYKRWNETDEPDDYYPPGAMFHYSNFGYQLLGKIVEEASGMSFAEFVRKRTLEPLGMNDTVFSRGWKDLPARCLPGFSHAQDVDGTRELLDVTHDQLALIFPAASDMWSTSADMARFVQFMLQGDERLLPEEQRLLMYEKCWEPPRPLNIHRSADREPNVSHPAPVRSTAFDLLDGKYAFLGGHMEGYLSSLLLDPQHGLGVVLLANAKDAPVGQDAVLEVARSLSAAKTRDFGDGALHGLSEGITGVYDTRTGLEAIVRIGDGLVRQRLAVPTVLCDWTQYQWLGGGLTAKMDGPWGRQAEQIDVVFSRSGAHIEAGRTRPTLVPGALLHSWRAERVDDIKVPDRVRAAPTRDFCGAERNTTTPTPQRPASFAAVAPRHGRSSALAPAGAFRSTRRLRITRPG